MFKKFLVLETIAVLFLMGFSTSVWAFAIALDPAKINLEAAAGTKISGEIKVSNNSTTDKQGFIAYSEDWVFNKDGSKEVRPTGSTPRSCSSWVTITPNEFEIGPNSFRKIKYTIDIPKDAAGGYYTLIFLETALPKQEGGFTGAAIKGRIGSTLSLTIKGTANPKGTITKMTNSAPDEDKPLYITVNFANEGNVVLWGKGVLQITDDGGNVYYKTDFENFNTLPGDTLERIFDWSGKLNQGKYRSSITVDFGTATPAFSEVAFEVVKAWDIEKISSVFGRAKTLKIYTKFANTGNLNLEPQGLVKIVNAKGKVIEEQKILSSLVLPNSAKVFTSGFKKPLAKGKYQVISEFKVDEETKTKEAELVVK